VQPASNYRGVLLRNTTEDSLVACATTCENTPKCNVCVPGPPSVISDACMVLLLNLRC